MKRVLKTLVLIGMVAGLVACGPAKMGDKCTTPGETRTIDGVEALCQTNEGDLVPEWTPR